MKIMYNDYPIEECAAACKKIIARGGTVYQKWTCENCGDRVTGNEPDKLFTHGHHEDCGHVTDIRKKGCSYIAILPGLAIVPTKGHA